MTRPLSSPLLVIHGGAGTIRDEDREAYTLGLIAARDAGFAVLAGGGDALAAALAAVKVMEDNPDAFNAGTGGSPNARGEVECDAAVMSGADGSAGAVGAVKTARNPVLLANKVRLETPHAFFVGAGAEALVDDPIDNESLLTERTRRAFRAWQQGAGKPATSATVGAVVRDARGDLAAATSTGGMLGKWPGRVGDSPIIGAGTYADSRVAVSCTGKGEAFIRAVTAKALAERLAAGAALEESVQRALEEVRGFGGSGGLISVTKAGELCVGFNSATMAYAWRAEDREGAVVGLEAGVFLL
ncbi:isoaspartyl peptidase/L-asparaginase family protein [Truepera radiovictrix]|nr:isoaspartyl peptidase/L-asparaginase family protein [Truepera radiovictrix]WMT57800.1 isoaspartyl peptidase/L-asparaginase family protein [Truepera radiovictrix]